MAIKRQIFYSFHFANDVFRVQQIRNLGALEDNKPVENVCKNVSTVGLRMMVELVDDSSFTVVQQELGRNVVV